MTIFLVRHGETDWNRGGRVQGREDIPLNHAGREQAARLASVFSCIGIGSIWSSPLSRAMDTAAIIARECGIGSVIPLEALRERDFGESSGMTREERARIYPDEESIPGQEAFDALQRRAIAALMRIAEDDPSERVLVVSHGAFIDSVIRALSGIPFVGLSGIALKNCCVTRLECRSGALSLVYGNREPEACAAV
jgi:broad specificity phosphatase PhoE